jgi:hypothetical protein
MEHLRNLRELQQCHRQNSMRDSSEDNGCDDVVDFDNAFL